MPSFVKRYANSVGRRSAGALGRYADEVRSGAFPGEQHTYAMPDDERAAFEAALAGDVRDRQTFTTATRASSGEFRDRFLMVSLRVTVATPGFR